MRFLIETENPDLAKSFSSYLKTIPIEHMLEVVKVSDWGNPSYGQQSYKIWIEDEDQYDRAIDHWNLFIKNPQDPSFQRETPPQFNPFRPQKLKQVTQEIPAPFTNFLIGLCVALFILSQFTSKHIEHSGQVLDYIASPVERTLLFDYPARAEKMGELVDTYGLTNWPSEAHNFKDQIISTPIFRGANDMAIAKLKNEPLPEKAPLFERIKQGEYWRLFSPILLHANLIHLFFNMMCVLVLGKEMERMIGIKKMIVFILITAVFSNSAQYLMSGYRFVGISGVICAMLAFIAVRQRIAPWEGYKLERSSVIFMLTFIFAMTGLSLIGFLADIYNFSFIATPIANTAHLTGLLAGFLLGRSSLFQWKG
jgi:GlpG protein